MVRKIFSHNKYLVLDNFSNFGKKDNLVIMIFYF